MNSPHAHGSLCHTASPSADEKLIKNEFGRNGQEKGCLKEDFLAQLVWEREESRWGLLIGGVHYVKCDGIVGRVGAVFAKVDVGDFALSGGHLD